MQDIANIIKNVESIYESNTAFTILKDYERVLDSLDLYVYDNWDLGELAMGPDVQRHWVTCFYVVKTKCRSHGRETFVRLRL